MVIQTKNGTLPIGQGHPCYVIAEIGINHNGSLDIARQLIDEAVAAGCSAVKFQKRTPEICVPVEQRNRKRDTPWGRITYMEYRYKVEFVQEDYEQIDAYCKEKGIDWLASCWDIPSVEFIEAFDPPFYKAASASLTDHELLLKMKATGKPLMISTGMSTMEEIQSAVQALGQENLMIAHSTSAYPCPLNELNLQMIKSLKTLFPQTPIGYSGHETGLATTVAAVVLGADFIERHFTLDRAMWGSDQAASVEPTGMRRLVKDIRNIETALGDGVKKVYESELGALKKLRRVSSQTIE
ncbi:MAG: N-acetylneuraminate synthase family protein [Bacteroidota bacterium]